MIVQFWRATVSFVLASLIFYGLRWEHQRPAKITPRPRMPFLRCVGGFKTFYVGPYRMKKISSLIPWFVICLIALPMSGITAAVDGAIAVVSSDPSVLLVTPLGEGKFHVEVVGVGFASLTVSGDADLGDGVREISQVFEFEVYDGATEADHFELQITEFAPATPSTDGGATVLIDPMASQEPNPAVTS